MEFFQKGCTLEFDLGQQVDGYELAGIVLRRVMQRPNKIKTFQLQKERSNSLSPQFGMKSRGWMALRLVYRYLFPSPPHQSIATSKSLCAAQTFEFLHLHSLHTHQTTTILVAYRNSTSKNIALQ
jgi:hypothetical protein